MHVIDLQGNEYPLQATSTNDNEVNGNQSFSATIYPSKVNKSFISDIQELWTVVDHDDVEHKIIYCKRQGQGELMTAEVKAIPLFFDVLDNDRIYERYDGSQTAQAAFTKIFADTGFTFVLVDSFNAVDWEGFGEGESKLETFKRAIERYKCEFRIVGNTVYLENRIGRDLQVMYRHKLNASNIVQEIDAKEMWTYAKGYGNYGDGEGGEDWQNAKLTREYTSPLAGILDIRHAPPIKNGNITDAATMDKQLKTLVDESLKISVSADIHDLRKQGYPIAQSQVGDRVFLIDERIGLDDEVRVVAQSVTRDWKGNVLDISITFGSEGLAKRHQSNINTAVKDITDILNGRKELPLSALDKRVQEISKIINGNTNSVFKYMSNGVMGWNGDNPNYMTRYVGDAIGFSKDGGKTYGTAMSAELGIVADYITTGTLRSIIVEAVEIYGSYIESRKNTTDYLYIQGAAMLSHGQFTRTWAGETETANLELGIFNGQFRFRNDDTGYRLYGTERGLSTSMDGAVDEFTSGTLEFHSQRFNETSRGVTLHSSYGTVGLVSDFSTIVSRSKLTNNIESEDYSVYIRPYRTAIVGNNDFRFWVKNNPSSSDTDGVLSYGSELTGQASGLRFQKTTVGRPTIYATNGNGDKGTGSFNAEYFEGTLLGNVRSPATNVYAMVAYDGELRVTDKNGYNDGTMTFRPVVALDFRSQSSEKIKTDIQAWEEPVLDMVIDQLRLYSYKMKQEVGTKNERLRHGLIIERETPQNLINGQGVDLYEYASTAIKAIQELGIRVREKDKEIQSLDERIKILEGV